MLTVKVGKKNAVAFPKYLIEDLGLTEGEKVDVTVKRNAVLITKETKDFFALEGALRDIDIESPIKELRKAWEKWKSPKSL